MAVSYLKARNGAFSAREIGAAFDSDSRAAATALRGAVNDGRVLIFYRPNSNGLYRFARKATP